jgi:hypothetical protein
MSYLTLAVLVVRLVAPLAYWTCLLVVQRCVLGKFGIKVSLLNYITLSVPTSAVRDERMHTRLQRHSEACPGLCMSGDETCVLATRLFPLLGSSLFMPIHPHELLDAVWY